jgi:hypothetical protein
MTGDQIRGATAQSMMDIRSLRKKLFPKDLFAEFAWDMILSLFVGLANNQVIFEADLISKTGVGENAGKRWIDHLSHSGHVARQHGGDVVLTPFHFPLQPRHSRNSIPREEADLTRTPIVGLFEPVPRFLIADLFSSAVCLDGACDTCRPFDRHALAKLGPIRSIPKVMSVTRRAVRLV